MTTICENDFIRLLAESVSDSLRDLLGEKPSGTVYRCILRRLYSKLGLTFVEKPDYRFVEYIRDLEGMENRVDPSPPITLREDNNGDSVKQLAIIHRQ